MGSDEQRLSVVLHSRRLEVDGTSGLRLFETATIQGALRGAALGAVLGLAFGLLMLGRFGFDGRRTRNRPIRRWREHPPRCVHRRRGWWPQIPSDVGKSSLAESKVAKSLLSVDAPSLGMAEQAETLLLAHHARLISSQWAWVIATIFEYFLRRTRPMLSQECLGATLRLDRIRVAP